MGSYSTSPSATSDRVKDSKSFTMASEENTEGGTVREGGNTMAELSKEDWAAVASCKVYHGEPG
jgi:hypothetical protein